MREQWGDRFNGSVETWDSGASALLGLAEVLPEQNPRARFSTGLG